MTDRIQFRRGTTAEWTAANPILAAAEPGVNVTTGDFKVGDGANRWSALSYASQGGLQTLFDARYATIASGYIGEGLATPATTGIAAVITDVTGATVTFTAPGGRRYKITAQADITQGASATVASIYIRDAASTTLRFVEANVTSGSQFAFTIFYTDVPAAGSVTYKMSGKTTAATMTVDSVTRASSILVEDIGPR